MCRVLSFCLAVATAIAAVGCNAGGPGDVNSANTNPSIQLFSPHEGDVIAPDSPVIARGNVQDREDLPDRLEVTLVLGNGEPIAVTPDSVGDWRYDLGILDPGIVSLEVQARDTRAGTASMAVSFEVLAPDLPPTADITAPEAGATFDERTNVNLAGIVSDDAPLELLTVEWSSSLQGPLGEDSPDLEGNVQFLTNELVPGVHTIRLIVSDGAQTVSDEVDIVINDVNRPPDLPLVLISPESPNTEARLVASLGNTDADPDEDVLSYTWTWLKDGVAIADLRNKTEVAPTYTTRGEVWRVEVTARDPGGLTSEVGASEVTIQNSAPSLSGANVSPSSPVVTSTLTVVVGETADLDLDSVSLTYEWLVNGAVVPDENTTRLTPGHFVRGDEVRARITPDDGTDTGSPLVTEAVTIGDALADGLTVNVSPDDPTLTDDLTCSVVTPATDVDGDSVTYTWRWTRNGTPYGDGDDRQNISAAELALGDLWRCTITPSSNGSSGTPASDQVTIRSGQGTIVVTEVMVIPDGGGVEGEYVELRNVTSTTIDLSGWVLRDDGGDRFVISPDFALPLAGGGYLVLGGSKDPFLTDGAAVDLVWTGFRLDDTGDEVVLEADGEVVDHMAWGASLGLPVTARAALNLDPDAFDALANDEATSWCKSTSPMGEGSFGTPGDINDACTCAASDTDGDGYGSNPDVCLVPDCDDADADSNPREIEICEDGIDNDCSQGDQLCDCDLSDDDGDGYGDVNGCSDEERDCDDTDATSYPAANERCDGIDNDCDGVIDDGLDQDGDGARVCPVEGQDEDCDDKDANAYPGNTEACDNKDNDCDTQVDEGFDIDADTYTTCEGDCNDNNPRVNPGAAEICEDGIDNNCGGGDATCACASTDSDGDGFGEGSSCPANQRDCNDSDPQTYPGAAERCDNVDNDCDGQADEGLDADADGVEICGSPADCNDTNGDIKPGAIEICDGVDQNCDGVVDEGFDADGDGYNTCGSTTEGEADCNDNNPLINPDALEKCDRVDNNCNGLTDEGRPDDYEPNDYENYAYFLGVVGVGGSETWELELTSHLPGDKDYFSFYTTDAGGRLSAFLTIEASDTAVEAELCAGTVEICLEVEALPYSTDEMYKPSLPGLPEGGEWILRVNPQSPTAYSCEPFRVTVRMQ